MITLSSFNNYNISYIKVEISLDEIQYDWSDLMKPYISVIKSRLFYTLPEKFLGSIIHISPTNEEYHGLYNLFYILHRTLYSSDTFVVDAGRIEGLLDQKCQEFLDDPKNRGLLTISSLNLV